MPTIEVQPGQRIRRRLDADLTDVTVPRDQETETHVNVHVKSNDKLDPRLTPIDDLYVVNKGTHRLGLRKIQGEMVDMHELTIEPKEGSL